MAKEKETDLHGEAAGITIGRIVHFVLDRGRAVGRCRPALIVNHLNRDSDVTNLLVFLDGPNDAGADPTEAGLVVPSSEGELVMRVEGVARDDDPHMGTWHFPEKVG